MTLYILKIVPDRDPDAPGHWVEIEADLEENETVFDLRPWPGGHHVTAYDYYRAKQMLQVVDLFSCVGMHMVGLQSASRIFKPIQFCESRPFRRRVLAHHFPQVNIHNDVRVLGDVPHDPNLPVIVIGGPPCQATSTISAISGSRSGKSLVGEQIRIAAALEADWCVVEQPPGHAQWEVGVAESLADHGYHVGRLEFSAEDLGAPYIRRRVFILACADLRGLEIAVATAPYVVRTVADRASAGHLWDASVGGVPRVDDGYVPTVDARGRISRDRAGGGLRRDRIEAIGDSNPPQMFEVIGHCILASYGLSSTDL